MREKLEYVLNTAQGAIFAMNAIIALKKGWLGPDLAGSGVVTGISSPPRNSLTQLLTYQQTYSTNLPDSLPALGQLIIIFFLLLKYSVWKYEPSGLEVPWRKTEPQKPWKTTLAN